MLQHRLEMRIADIRISRTHRFPEKKVTVTFKSSFIISIDDT
jgi:hypothetical protein